MAQPSSPANPPSSPAPAVTGSCCSGGAFAYLLIRVTLGLMLVLAGAEKFKSPAPPYTYSTAYWHDEKDPVTKEVTKSGRWMSVAKPVYEFGGFNNPAVFTVKGSNALSWMFFTFAEGLPYAMIGVGLCIIIGFLNRLSLFAGGAIWLSLALGQMTLPDNPTVSMLVQYTMYYAIALALVKYNRFALTRF